MGFALFHDQEGMAVTKNFRKIKRNFKKALDFSQKMCIIMKSTVFEERKLPDYEKCTRNIRLYGL